MKSLNKIALSLLSLTLLVPALQGVNRPWEYQRLDFSGLVKRLRQENSNDVSYDQELPSWIYEDSSWYSKAYDNVKSGAKKAWDYAKANPRKTAGAVVGTAATAGLIYLLAKSLVKKQDHSIEEINKQVNGFLFQENRVKTNVIEEAYQAVYNELYNSFDKATRTKNLRTFIGARNNPIVLEENKELFESFNEVQKGLYNRLVELKTQK